MKVLKQYRRKIREHPQFEQLAKYYALGLPLSYFTRHFGGAQALRLSASRAQVDVWVISPKLLRGFFRKTPWEKQRRENLRLKKRQPSAYAEKYSQEYFWEGIDYHHLKSQAEDAGKWNPATPAELHEMLEKYKVALVGDHYPVSDEEQQRRSDEAYLYVLNCLPEDSQRQEFAETHKLPALSLGRIGHWRSILNGVDTRSLAYKHAGKMLRELARSESRRGGKRYEDSAIVALMESCYWFAPSFVARLRFLSLSMNDLDDIWQGKSHPLASKLCSQVAPSRDEYIRRAHTPGPNFARRELIRSEFPEVIRKFPKEVLRMHRWGKWRLAIYLCAALLDVSVGRVKAAIRTCRKKTRQGEEQVGQKPAGS